MIMTIILITYLYYEYINARGQCQKVPKEFMCNRCSIPEKDVFMSHAVWFALTLVPDLMLTLVSCMQHCWYSSYVSLTAPWYYDACWYSTVVSLWGDRQKVRGRGKVTSPWQRLRFRREAEVIEVGLFQAWLWSQMQKDMKFRKMSKTWKSH